MPILLLTLLKNGVETSTVTNSAHSGIGVLSQQKLMTHAAKCISWADMITKTLNLIMIQFCMVFAVYAAPVQWIIKAFIANVLSAYFYRLNWVSGLWIGYKWARFQFSTRHGIGLFFTQILLYHWFRLSSPFSLDLGIEVIIKNPPAQFIL